MPGGRVAAAGSPSTLAASLISAYPLIDPPFETHSSHSSHSNFTDLSLNRHNYLISPCIGEMEHGTGDDQ